MPKGSKKRPAMAGVMQAGDQLGYPPQIVEAVGTSAGASSADGRAASLSPSGGSVVTDESGVRGAAQAAHLVASGGSFMVAGTNAQLVARVSEAPDGMSASGVVRDPDIDAIVRRMSTDPGLFASVLRHAAKDVGVAIKNGKAKRPNEPDALAEYEETERTLLRFQGVLSSSASAIAEPKRSRRREAVDALLAIYDEVVTYCSNNSTSIGRNVARALFAGAMISVVGALTFALAPQIDRGLMTVDRALDTVEKAAKTFEKVAKTASSLEKPLRSEKPETKKKAPFKNKPKPRAR